MADTEATAIIEPEAETDTPVEETTQPDTKHSITLVDVIRTAIQIPGVKVSRQAFLAERFKDEPEELLCKIIKSGPVKAGCDRKRLKKEALKLINNRTMMSTAASFAAGLPGGLAMAATIPADLAQYYGVALRMAQELSYLYGEEDLWEGNEPDSEKVTNQLILYCGVMLGSTGAAQTVRILSSTLARQALKKLPQKALTKTFYYPIVKSIAKAFGAKMTKEVFAKGVSKVVPVIGGVVSGGITLFTLKPMGKRLADTLDTAHFEYTDESFEADWNKVMEVSKQVKEEEASEQEIKDNAADTGEEPTETNAINTPEDTADPEVSVPTAPTPAEEKDVDSNMPAPSIFDEISKAKQMLDMGIITEEEFAQIKAKLISKL